MVLSGHSVCNDKQEKNIWMFVHTIVYLQGKLNVFRKFTVLLGESWKDFKDGQAISSEQYSNRDSPVVILLARESKCFFSESFCRQDHSSLAPCVSQRPGTNEWVAFLEMCAFVRPTPPSVKH